MEDTVTILTCVGENAVATKTIRVDDDGTIIVIPFRATLKFTHREEKVHDIYSLGELIRAQESKSKELAIRGQIIEGKPKVVRRLGESNEEGAFRDIGRRWMMIDIDDLPLPDFIDPTEDPEAAVKWARASLPRPFRKATCYYQFSSRQSLPEKLGLEPPKVAKAHLFFWLDRPVTSEEWRRYINE